MQRRIPLAFASAVLLAGCGGGSDGSGDGTGTLTLGLTDAPVDEIAELRLYIEGVTVKRPGGPPETYPVNLTDCGMMPTDDCNPVDLLSLQDGLILTVLADQPMLAGEYNWLRLDVDNERSYVVEDAGGMNENIDVRVPSQRGLQLSGGFTILADRTTNLVMDWDARQGLAHAVGTDTYIVKPSIRLTDLAQWGTIEGTVAETTDTGECPDGGVVYVFEGDVVPDDIDNNETNPLVTASVGPVDRGGFGYTVHYLPSGESGLTYTVALNCDPASDFVPTTDALDDSDDDIVFVTPQTTIVTDGQTSTVDF